VLHDYARDANLFDPLVIEQMQFAYLRRASTRLDRDPYRVFVYTTLQERATQVSHANVGSCVRRRSRPWRRFSRTWPPRRRATTPSTARFFNEVLARDPNRALHAAALVMPGIDMPGVAMPHFRELADVVRRVGIYGPREYLQIVKEQIDFWKIGALRGLNALARSAQEKSWRSRHGWSALRT